MCNTPAEASPSIRRHPVPGTHYNSVHPRRVLSTARSRADVDTAFHHVQQRGIPARLLRRPQERKWRSPRRPGRVWSLVTMPSDLKFESHLAPLEPNKQLTISDLLAFRLILITMANEAKDPEGKLLTASLIGFVLGTLVIFFPVIIVQSESPRHDSYSIALTAIDGVTWQAGGPDASPLSPAFNLTLYVENTRFIGENCFSYGRLAVSYGGVAMGEVRVPGWCAGRKSPAEVEALVRGKDVQLSVRPQAAHGGRAAMGNGGAGCRSHIVQRRRNKGPCPATV
ncbi:hypothetical protein EJB05_38746, partial [Eragrostis curvula]